MKEMRLLTGLLLLTVSCICQYATTLDTNQDKKVEYSTKYPVGFRTFILTDLSRPPISEQIEIDRSAKGRIIPTHLWYPTSKAAGKKLSLRDYLRLKGSETDTTLADTAKESLAKAILSGDYNASADTINLLFNTDMQFVAIQNAPYISRKFPLIVMVHNDPVGFVSLAEQLASNGFIVANFPITGTSSKKFDWETIAGIETELKDLDFVVKKVSKIQMVDTTTVIPLGYSYGAMAAVAYQFRNKNVKAVVSLDGGIGSAWGGDLFSKLPAYDVRKIARPLLHLWSDLENSHDHRWLETYRCSDRYLLKFSKLRHGDFVEGVLFETLVPGITSKSLGVPVKGNTEQYNTLIASVVQFTLWIATGSKSNEIQLKAIDSSFTAMRKQNCLQQ